MIISASYDAWAERSIISTSADGLLLLISLVISLTFSLSPEQRSNL